MKVKSLKTQRYAQPQPWLPQITLVEGQEYSDPETPLIVLKRAVQCGMAEVIEVVEKIATVSNSFSRPPPLEIETSKVEVESKEQPKKAKSARKGSRP